MNKIYKVKLKTTNVLKNTANRVGFYDDEELIKYLELMNDEIDFKKMGLFAYQISFFDPVNENKINISDKFLKDYLFFDFCNNVTNKK